MNPAHIHLVLNHLPTIGFGIGLALYVVALLSKQSDLQRVGFAILFLMAAISIVTYVSGNDARESLKKTPGVSNPLMEAHETAALIAMVFMQITGFFSWMGLWLWGKPSRFARINVGIVLVFAILAAVLMSRAAYFGGAIRHPETEAAANIPIDESVPTLARAWGIYVQDHSWVWPTCETLHFVGLSLLFGAVMVVNLRMMGIGKSMLSVAALRQLLPLGMLGFTLNLVTGMMFFVATPEQYTGYLFLLKMTLIAAGALNLLYFMLAENLSKVGDGDDARPATKLIAASAIVIWIAVLFCGHMLPWLGNSF